MCAIGINGVIGYEYKTGAYNTESFLLFIESKLVPFFRQHPNSVLVMENASLHKSSVVVNNFRDNSIVTKYLVPYSPKLNPIEEFFSMVKSKYNEMKSLNNALTIEEILTKILHFENNYSEQCRGFYRNMINWVDKAQRKEPFI